MRKTQKEFLKTAGMLVIAIIGICLCSMIINVMFISCSTTVDLEKENSNQLAPETEIDAAAQSENQLFEDEVTTLELIKESDVTSAIVHVEAPEIRYTEKKETKPDLSGTAALKQNLEDIRVLPEYQDGHLKGWVYKEQQIYQVHCQTYHSTIIQLEPGEEMQSVPYISETDVWRLSRGVGYTDGIPTQYIIIKPDYSGLTSTLIIITNLRVYQLELLSYKDHYMPYVKWIYPNPVNDLSSWKAWENRKNEKTKGYMSFTTENLQYMSFDYTIKYSANKKPVWCPELVYDDGKFTYIVLDRTALHTQFPTAFINKKEILNYEVQENVLVINQLIETVTLKDGKNKVTINKKRNKTESSTDNVNTENK